MPVLRHCGQHSGSFHWSVIEGTFLPKLLNQAAEPVYSKLLMFELDQTSYSGGLSSLLIHFSAAFTGSSASHLSQAKIAPTGVVCRFSGPRHLGHLSAGRRRGIEF
jgi:hypothetical protein